MLQNIYEHCDIIDIDDFTDYLDVLGFDFLW